MITEVILVKSWYILFFDKTFANVNKHSSFLIGWVPVQSWHILLYAKKAMDVNKRINFYMGWVRVIQLTWDAKKSCISQGS